MNHFKKKILIIEHLRLTLKVVKNYSIKLVTQLMRKINIKVTSKNKVANM